MKAKPESKTKQGKTGARPTREALAGSAAAQLLERISDGFVAFDVQMNYTYVNARGGEFLGRKPEDLIGKNYWVEYPEAKGTVFANAYLRALKEQTPLQIEDYYEPFDRWFENRIYPSREGLSIFFHDVTDRKKAEQALRETQERLARIVETIPDGVVIADRDGAVSFANPSAERILGLSRADITQRSYNDPQWKITALDGSPFPDEDLPFARVKAGGGSVYNVEHAIVYPGGRRAALSINASPLRDAKGNFDGMVASITDITERRRMENLLTGEKQVLEMVANGEALPNILDTIARNIESQSAGMFCTILLLDADGVHVRHGAAPSMKETFVRAIDGQPIGPNAGSCGTAAYRKEPVYVTDIASDPLWADYRRVALEHGLRACWSTPIKSSEGRVLGTFAMYYGEPRAPEPADLRLIEFATNLAGIGIERKQTDEALRESERLFRETLANLHLVSVMLDLEGRVTFCNDYLLRLTGWERDEVLGQDWFARFVPGERGEVRESFVAALSTGNAAAHYENPILTRAGEQRDILWSNTILRDAEGRIIGTTSIGEDITERKQAEEELRRSQASLEDAQAQVHLGNWELDLAAQTGYWSKEMFRLYGMEPASSPMPFSEFLECVHPEDRQRLLETQARVRQTGETVTEEYRINPIRGPSRVISAQYSCVKDDQGKIVRLVGTSLDITERKRAQAEAEFQAHLLANVHDAVVATDARQVVRYWNYGAEALYGWSSDEVLGRPVRDVIRSEFSDTQRTEAAKALEETGRYRVEVLQYDRQGDPHWVEGKTIALRDEAGALTGFVSINRDITERKRAEEKLRLSEERFSKAFFISPAGMTITRIADGKFIDVNDSFLGMFGFSREETIGHTSTELNMWTPEERQKLIQAQLASRGLRDFELQARSKSGRSVNILFSSRPIELEGETCHVTTMIDITARKRTEAELQQLNTELEQRVVERTAELKEQYVRAATLEERQRLARDLHDVVSQTLFSASVIAETLPRLWQRDPEQVRQGLGELHRLTRGALAEMRALLLELRPEAMTEINLADLLGHLANALTGRTQLEASLTTEPLPTLPAETRLGLYRIAQEALNNVVKHARAQRVDISLAPLTVGEAHGVQLRLRDDGRGFDPASVPSGHLGLGIMRERAEAIGASITFQTQPGAGTEVIVTWPAP